MSLLETIYRRAPRRVQEAMLNAYALRLAAYRRGRPFRQAVETLRESERISLDRIRARQDEMVRRVVGHAYAHSSFYHARMRDAGLTPAEVTSVDELARLPLVTKQDIREHLGEMITLASPSRAWTHGHTSGTTGSPLSLWYDRQTCVMNDVADWRQKSWGGMTERDWVGVLLGRVVVPVEQQSAPFWRVNRVFRQVWFSSFHLTPEHLDAYVGEIRRRGLRFLEGYPSTMFILARHVVERGERLPMQAVFTSSETLHDIQRETMREAFGVVPFDFYGHAERTIFATECGRHDGKHLVEEYGYTEVVDDQGRRVPDGDIGYLVGTSLHNRALPMLRYRTGDLSRILTEPCDCGRTSRRIASIATKAEDVVITPDGRMISPSILTHPFKPLPEILKSQIIQRRVDELLVKVVPSPAFTEDHRRRLLTALGERIGEGVNIQVELVDDIPRERSGKFRWVISEVSHSTHFSWT